MSEEEKKAIKIVNSLKEWGKIHFIVKDRSYARLTYNEVYLLLNLIKKQQKELNRLKEKNKKLYEQNQIYLSNGSNVKLELHIKNNYIRKDKIQEKIKEYDGLKIIDKQAYEEQIKPLKELWEDNRFDV